MGEDFKGDDKRAGIGRKIGASKNSGGAEGTLATPLCHGYKYIPANEFSATSTPFPPVPEITVFTNATDRE